MATDNVTPIKPMHLTRRKGKAAPTLDDMEQAINGLSLATDWVIYQAECKSADDAAACAVLDLLDRASKVLKDAMNAKQTAVS